MFVRGSNVQIPFFYLFIYLFIVQSTQKESERECVIERGRESFK